MLNSPSALRVAVLTSGRAPGLRTLLAATPADGFNVVAVVASDPASTALLETSDAGVTCLVHDIRAHYAGRGKRLGDLTVRAEYDAATAQMLHGFHPDVVVACGYLHLLTTPMLAAFPDRIVSVHDADLALKDQDGLPRYRGLHATLDAVRAGERETRSTVHIVREALDTGPGLVVSHAFPVYIDLVQAARACSAMDILKAYAYAQREWMMRAAWGALLHAALVTFADGGVEVMGTTAWVRGMPGPLIIHQHDDARGRPAARMRVRP